MKRSSLPFLIGSLFAGPDTVSVVLVGVVAPNLKMYLYYWVNVNPWANGKECAEVSHWRLARGIPIQSPADCWLCLGFLTAQVQIFIVLPTRFSVSALARIFLRSLDDRTIDAKTISGTRRDTPLSRARRDRGQCGQN